VRRIASLPDDRSLVCLLVVGLLAGALLAVPTVAGAGGAGVHGRLPADIDGTFPNAPSSSGTPNGTPSNGTIVELYPNPVADGDVGEYLIVDLPVAGNWSLSDGHHETPLPRNASGRTILSRNPEAAAAHVDDEVLRLPGYLPLADDGDRITLAFEGIAVDSVRYERAPEAEVWNREWEGGGYGTGRGGWRPYGYEPHDLPGPHGPADVDVFVLPDASEAPHSAVTGAEERILLAGYTFESARIAEALIAAHRRGVTVRVLVEGRPVGGFSGGTARTLDRLLEAGIEPRVLAGDRRRFSFHHPKYAVVDDRAVVLTENWKPSGTGGAGNRGWGAVVHDGGFAADLADVFDRDASAGDAIPWRRARSNLTTHGSTRSTEEYPTRFEPRRTTANEVELLLAPENAADRLTERIDAADDRILVMVPRTAGPEWRLLEAVIRAADRGVESRVLLSNAWYDREENAALAARLNRRADREGLPLSVAVTEPRGRYGKIHAKGMVIDDSVVIGSLNWNEAAATTNREVLVVLESPQAASYFEATYAADWRGGGVQLPIGLAGGVAIAAATVAVVARREVSFV
jgi:phosphatidylserine/phosphatidylglycerophosphate/cardiolipin synthase-like enzyme